MEKLHEFIETIISKQNQLFCYELCIYPGTFYPFHQGHQEILNRLPPKLLTIFIPDNNPQKNLNQKRTIKYYEENIHLSEFQYAYFGLMQLNQKNYTYHLLTQLQAKFPNIKLSLAIGMDSFINLPTWFQYENLIKTLFRFYVLSRSEDKSEKDLIHQKIKKINQEIEIVYLGHHLFEHLASSKIK